MDMNIILHDPIVSDLFVQFIKRCNYLINIHNIDGVKDLQSINNTVPRDDFVNDLDYTTSRERIHVNSDPINFKELFNLSDQCITSQTFEDVCKQINNLSNIELNNTLSCKEIIDFIQSKINKKNE